MKATGVVRRIDDLGRIVIPKEIRKTLRVKDGESLEIYLDNDSIVLKKYFPLEKTADFYKNYVASVYDIIGENIAIVDRDTILAFAGELKKKYLDKRISKVIDGFIENRVNVYEKEKKEFNLSGEETEKASYILAPIISDGDAIGAVIVLSKNNELDNFYEKTAIIAAKFLGKYIE